MFCNTACAIVFIFYTIYNHPKETMDKMTETITLCAMLMYGVPYLTFNIF